jgi:hypothetical protein
MTDAGVDQGAAVLVVVLAGVIVLVAMAWALWGSR